MTTKHAALTVEEGLAHRITEATSKDLATVAWAIVVPVWIALATPLFTWLLFAAILLSPILLTWSIVQATRSAARHARLA